MRPTSAEPKALINDVASEKTTTTTIFTINAINYNVNLYKIIHTYTIDMYMIQGKVMIATKSLSLRPS